MSVDTRGRMPTYQEVTGLPDQTIDRSQQVIRDDHKTWATLLAIGTLATAVLLGSLGEANRIQSQNTAPEPATPIIYGPDPMHPGLANAGEIHDLYISPSNLAVPEQVLVDSANT